MGAFSLGHLRGSGGAIPEAKKIPGGLLGADYEIKDNRYCLKKIYTGGLFNPREKAPLAQPGLNVAAGDCVLAIEGQELNAGMAPQRQFGAWHGYGRPMVSPHDVKRDPNFMGH